MSIIIEFEYRNKEYRYTINDDMVDMNHYDVVWDYWFYENDNENQYYDIQDEENELVFEVTANKRFVDEEKELIDGSGIYINVYENVDADDFSDTIKGSDINVLYQ